MSRENTEQCLPRGAGESVRRNGVIQIVMGIISFIFGIAQYWCERKVNYIYSTLGYLVIGMWCGAFMLIGGSITVNTSRTKSVTKLKVAFCNNVFALLVGLTLAGLSSASLYLVGINRCDFSRNYGDGHYSSTSCRLINATLAMYCLLLIMSIAHIVLSAMTLVITRKAISALKDTNLPQVETVQEDRVGYRYDTRRKNVKKFGMIQIIVGLLTTMFGIIVSDLTEQLTGRHYSINGYIGSGVWSGLLLVTAGSLTISSIRFNTHKRMLVSCAMNVLALLISIMLVMISVTSCTTNEFCRPFLTSKPTIYGLQEYPKEKKSCKAHNAVLALDIVLVIMGLMAGLATSGCLVLAHRECREKREDNSISTVTPSSQSTTTTATAGETEDSPPPPAYGELANIPPKLNSDLPPSYDSLQFI